MKIRQGFVSNSSSSSFLIVGVEAAGLTKKQKDDARKAGLCVDDDYVGVYSSIYDYDVKTFSMEHIAKAQLKVKCALGEDTDVKIIIGVMTS